MRKIFAVSALLILFTVLSFADGWLDAKSQIQKSFNEITSKIGTTENILNSDSSSKNLTSSVKSVGITSTNITFTASSDKPPYLTINFVSATVVKKLLAASPNVGPIYTPIDRSQENLVNLGSFTICPGCSKSYSYILMTFITVQIGGEDSESTNLNNINLRIHATGDDTGKNGEPYFKPSNTGNYTMVGDNSKHFSVDYGFYEYHSGTANSFLSLINQTFAGNRDNLETVLFTHPSNFNQGPGTVMTLNEIQPGNFFLIAWWMRVKGGMKIEAGKYQNYLDIRISASPRF